MILFEKRKIAFVHVARTGGTMVQDLSNGKLIRPHHQSVQYFREHHPLSNDYELWCVIRDPVMRFQSLLNLARRNHGHQQSVQFTKDIVISQQDLMDNNRFIKFLQSISMDQLVDNHWSSQWRQLSFNGRLGVDRIFIFEKDLSDLCESLGIINPHSVNKVTHTDILDDNMIKFVKEKYYQDYDILAKQCDVRHWR